MEQAILNEARDRFLQVARATSASQTAQFVRCEEPVINHIPDYRPGKVLANEMIIVSISGENLQILFKIHFSHTQAQARLRATSELSNVPLNVKDVDFMKELGNQFGGAMCRVLSNNNLAVGLSIPLCVRGYYEIYSEYSERIGPLIKIADGWRLTGDFGDLYFSGYYEVMDQKVLPILSELQAETESDDDEIDFL